MKILFDLLPIALFFVAYKLGDVYVATAVAVIATVAQVGWLLLRRRRVEPMLWVSLAIVVIFGGATLLLHDDTFIKWKPTVLYWAFALALGLAEPLFGRNPMRSLMGAQLTLPDPVWRVLNRAWAGFFALLGGLNLVIAFQFPLDTWVQFKVFGTTILMIIFVIAQGIWLSRVMPADDQ
jgi:intracellular septation protein